MDKVSLWQIFGVFVKIGAFTIGGGYAMIPVIEAELTRRKWIKEEDFPDIITLAQTAPGLLAVNMAIFSGYRMRGVKGSIVATLGSVLPSFLIILLVAMFFTNFQDNPYVIKIFKGMRPVAIALIAVPMVRMIAKGNHSLWAWALTMASMVAVVFLKVSPIYILLVVIACSLGITYLKEGRK